MSVFEYYLVAVSVVLFGIVIIIGRGLLRMQTEYVSLKRYAGLVTEFVMTISDKPQPEVIKEFNRFVDNKFKGDNHA